MKIGSMFYNNNPYINCQLVYRPQNPHPKPIIIKEASERKCLLPPVVAIPGSSSLVAATAKASSQELGEKITNENSRENNGIDQSTKKEDSAGCQAFTPHQL